MHVPIVNGRRQRCHREGWPAVEGDSSSSRLDGLSEERDVIIDARVGRSSSTAGEKLTGADRAVSTSPKRRGIHPLTARRTSLLRVGELSDGIAVDSSS